MRRLHKSSAVRLKFDMASWLELWFTEPILNDMKNAVLGLVAGMVAIAAGADGADWKSDVKAAAGKLADATNYSWTTTASLEGVGPAYQPGPLAGKAEKGGYTHYTARQGEVAYEVVSQGEKIVCLYQNRWFTPDQLAASNMDWLVNLLRSFLPPAAEASELATLAQNHQPAADGIISAKLGEDAVKKFLMRGRRALREIKDIQGTVKFWVNSGRLTKYEYQLSGTIFIGEDRREQAIKSTTRVEIKDVSATKVVVPEAAAQLFK